MQGESAKVYNVILTSTQDAWLQLASVNLPGGVQRMRTYEVSFVCKSQEDVLHDSGFVSQDQLQMRSLFVEGDLISVRYSFISVSN
jgi:hypothetical protein